MNRVARVVAGSALAVGLAVGFHGPASAMAPSATVTPASGLSDNAVVQVSAQGLQAGTSYDIGQCAWVETGVLACNPANFVKKAADAGGALQTPLTVRSNFNGVLPDGSSWGAVDCTKIECLVGVSDATGNGPAGVAISFK